MAVIHELQVDVSIDPKDLERVKSELAKKFWQWYTQNLDMILIDKRILFWKVTLKVRNLKEVFEKLFGPPPLYIPVE